MRRHIGDFPPEPRPRYVEFDGREYELVTVHPWAKGPNGEPCKCHVNLTEQRIEVGGRVPLEDREPLVRKMMAKALGLTDARFVPVVSASS